MEGRKRGPQSQFQLGPQLQSLTWLHVILYRTHIIQRSSTALPLTFSLKFVVSSSIMASSSTHCYSTLASPRTPFIIIFNFQVQYLNSASNTPLLVSLQLTGGSTVAVTGGAREATSSSLLTAYTHRSYVNPSWPPIRGIRGQQELLHINHIVLIK